MYVVGILCFLSKSFGDMMTPPLFCVVQPNQSKCTTKPLSHQSSNHRIYHQVPTQPTVQHQPTSTPHWVFPKIVGKPLKWMVFQIMEKTLLIHGMIFGGMDNPTNFRFNILIDLRPSTWLTSSLVSNPLHVMDHPSISTSRAPWRLWVGIDQPGLGPEGAPVKWVGG